MQSGFSGGDGNGRSMNNQSQSLYSRSQQLPGLFLDPTLANSQMSRQTSPTNFIGKRTLAEFQSHREYLPLSNVHGLLPVNRNYLRSVKPRVYQHSSPISPLSPIEFSSITTDSSSSISSDSSQYQHQQRFGFSVLQQLRSHQQNQTLLGLRLPYMNQVQSPVVGLMHSDSDSDSEKKTHSNRLLLQQLEKQLLDDDDDDDNENVEGDVVSVITNTNSEWSETIQNLIGTNNNQNQNQTQSSINPNNPPISASPTSPCSSSSSSVASPTSTTICSKQSLMEAATAIYEGKTDVATEILSPQTLQVSKPKPNSEQRVIDLMTRALKSRLNPVDNPPPSVTELFGQEHARSTQLLYDLSPCFKLSFVAANLAILEALLLADQPNNNNKVHVVDFDIGHTVQYIHLLQTLSSHRQNGRSILLKITTVAADNNGEERLKTVRDTLSQVSKILGVGLEFKVMIMGQKKLAELNRELIGCEPEEPLAVNFAFKLYRVPDESVSTENPRDELLRRVKGLAPKVVTLVEQELNTNTATFLARVNETCSYYGNLLESIESTFPRENNSERVKIEEVLNRKITNSVASEGIERVERCEVFGKWRARMGMAGLELKPLSQNVSESIRNHRVHSGFMVKEENGRICFGWMGRTLTVASAWR